MLFSLPPPTKNVYSTGILPTPLFAPPPSHNPILLNPLLPNPYCAPYTLPLGITPVTHPPCHTPNPLPLLLPLPFAITHASIWCRGRSRSIGPRAACSLKGMPSGSCSAYATMQSGLSSTPPGQQLRARPDFPIPVDLQAYASPAARDAFKRATDARADWLACSAAFCVAILDSIGKSNCLAISDPDTYTLHLSPRDIINVMTSLHGALPLKKKLSALIDLPADIVTFRGHLARLTTARQAPLPLDAYRLFLASLSSFPVFHQYTLLWTVAPPTLGSSTPTSSPTPPFDPLRAMSKGTRTEGARMMAWEGT